MRVDVSASHCIIGFGGSYNLPKLHLIEFETEGLTFNICFSGPEYEEVEVHLLREKTGFGFRILGGDEAVQAVSPDARDKARMGRAGPHI